MNKPDGDNTKSEAAQFRARVFKFMDGGILGLFSLIFVMPWLAVPVLILVFVLVYGLYVFLLSPGSAPPSANTPIVASADGLLRLFEEECLKQRSLDWARKSHKFRVDSCYLFDEDSTCHNTNFDILWTVPTTKGTWINMKLEGTYGDYPLPAGPLRCSLSTGEKLDPVLRDKAIRLSSSDAWTGAYLMDGDSEGKNWSLNFVPRAAR